uniref:Uncharacterized protein n=1 Tax=Romanomermis culicivorax TaxID=13658 RepID=A0A915HXS1_ROMCU
MEADGRWVAPLDVVSAQYCRSNVNDCLWRACNEINKYTPPGCGDSRVKDEVRQRLSTCYDLNACFRDPITVGCTSTLSDCPMLHMCRQGKCWPKKISNFRCSSNYDCKNEVYECINNECKIRPFGDSSGNTFLAPRPSSTNFYPSPGDLPMCINSQCKIRPFGTSSVDDYYPIPTPTGQCRLSDQCAPDQMCRQDQCWPKRIPGKYCQSSYDCFQNSLYE